MVVEYGGGAATVVEERHFARSADVEVGDLEDVGAVAAGLRVASLGDLSGVKGNGHPTHFEELACDGGACREGADVPLFLLLL